MNIKEIESGSFQAFKMLILGKSNNGKTYNFVKWFLPVLKKKKLFQPEHIIIFAHNGYHDPSLRPLIEYCQKHYDSFIKDNVMKHIDLQLIQKLQYVQDQIKTRIAEKEMNGIPLDPKNDVLEKFLIIFDDQIASGKLGRDKESKQAIQELFTSGRHIQISVVGMMQKFKGNFDTTSRDQFDILVIQTCHTNAIKSLIEEFNDIPVQKGGEKIFYEFYRDAIKQETFEKEIDGDCKIVKQVGQLIINLSIPFGYGEYQSCYSQKKPAYDIDFK